VQVETKTVEHYILLLLSAFYQAVNLAGEAVRQFLVLQTIPVTATAITDDQVDIVR
jgi:hypothetical protein